VRSDQWAESPLKLRPFSRNERPEESGQVTYLLARTDVILVPLSQKVILDWDKSTLHPAQQVLFVGYPNGIRDRMHNLPVARGGLLASLPTVDFDGEPDFLIDAKVWPGSSGSPVFVEGNSAQAPFSLIGILHSSRLVSGQPNTFIGLGYAVKSTELLELLKHAFSLCKV
jgi:hypothetical protein